MEHWSKMVKEKLEYFFGKEYGRRLTARKIKFSIKDFFSKYDQIRRKMRIWSNLLKKSLMENFIFCAVAGRYFLKNLKK